MRSHASSVRKNTDVEDYPRPGEKKTGIIILKLLIQTDSVCLHLHVAAKKKEKKKEKRAFISNSRKQQAPVLIRSDAE